jgi:hypothetical protein
VGAIIIKRIDYLSKHCALADIYTFHGFRTWPLYHHRHSSCSRQRSNGLSATRLPAEKPLLDIETYQNSLEKHYAGGYGKLIPMYGCGGANRSCYAALVGVICEGPETSGVSHLLPTDPAAP